MTPEEIQKRLDALPTHPPVHPKPDAPTINPAEVDAEDDGALSHSREFLNHERDWQDDLPPIWKYTFNDDGSSRFLLSHVEGFARFVPCTESWSVFYRGRWHPRANAKMQEFCTSLSRHQMASLDGEKATLAEEAEGPVTEAQSKKRKAIAAAQRARAKYDKQKTPETQAAMDQAEADSVILQEKCTAVQKSHKASNDDLEAKVTRVRLMGNLSTISKTLAIAASNGYIRVPSEEWDADPMLIGTKNGVMCLKSGAFREGLPGDLITRALAVDYIPGAACPNWDRFISRVLPDKEIAAYVQKIAGYSLTALTDDTAFYFLYGTGQNGKSIFVRTLATLFGSYGQKARSSIVEEPKHGGEPRFDLGRLAGVRFLYGQESKQGVRLNESILKSLVSGDPMTGEEKFLPPFTFEPVAKIWLMGNHKPVIVGTDTGIWQRVRLIPFTATISEEEKVPVDTMLRTLFEEGPGILNWLLEGLRECNGRFIIPPPDSVAAAVQEYREGEDDLGEFIRDCIYDAPLESVLSVGKLEVFTAYEGWAKDNGVRHTLTQKRLTRALNERGPDWVMNSDKNRWKGKCLREKSRLML
jgi:putative DNA primase/helicase